MTNQTIYLGPQSQVERFYQEKRGSVPDFQGAHKYLDEEVTEMWEEMEDEPFGPLDLSHVNREKLAKELADVLFCLYGVAITAGIDLDKAFELVAASNMTKERTPEGKVRKGESYVEPDMSGALL